MPKKSNHYVDDKKFTAEVSVWAEQARDALEVGDDPPRMTEYMGKCLLDIATNMSNRANFVGYCVDTETEALTKKGWVRHDEITTDDVILSYDTEEKKLVWSDIKSIYRDQYQGKMYRLTNRGLDALVTPGHKFVSKQRGIIPVEEICNADNIVLMGDYIESPPQKYDDAFVESVGWAVTEGHYEYGKNTHSIVLYQNEGENAQRIRKALNESDIHYKEYCRRENNISWRCTGNVINTIHSVAPNRVLSMEFIHDLTQEQKLLLIETMVAGDGWYRPNGGMSYGQKCKDHMDAFLVLCTFAGIRVGVSGYTYETSDGDTRQMYTANFYKNPARTCSAQNINFHGGQPGPGGVARGNKGLVGKKAKPNFPTVDYDGIVWCPETEYGTFVCRRNNNIYVTGNSYKDLMVSDALEDVIKYLKNFDPEKANGRPSAFSYVSRIMWFAFLRRMKKEDKQHDIKQKLIFGAGEIDDIANIQEHDDTIYENQSLRNIKSMANDFYKLGPKEESEKEKKEKGELEDYKKPSKVRNIPVE